MALDFFHLLVIDDDELVVESLKLGLPENWKMTALTEAPKKLDRFYHAALVDMHLTDNYEQAEGPGIIKQLHDLDSHLEIVAFSGDLNTELMEQCLASGASRYLAKPVHAEELRMLLEKIEAWHLLSRASQRRLGSQFKWVGSSKTSQKIKKEMAQLKGEDGPILITGESGTGKEVVAQLLYEQENDNRPFLSVNVSAVPENLFESEFFGHVKGAFTGADQNKMGIAEAAHGGDLFLDEIEALSLPLQAKLLRFLESGEIRRVGSHEARKVRTRVIAATNQPLPELVEKQAFREDLMYRLSGKQIQIPPLRERQEDIKELAEYFLGQHPFRQKSLAKESIETLKKYDWPGNIRELKRVCEQLLLNAPLPVIRPGDILKLITPATDDLPLSSINFKDGLVQLLNQFEASVVKACLDTYDDIDEAAKALKISRSSLYKKIKDYEIDWRN